jgi:hypothetical protein
LEAPNIDAARRAAGDQARSLQATALDAEQFENDLIAGGLRLDQGAMTAVQHAITQLGLAADAWEQVITQLSKHAQGEEYAASGHAASTAFLAGDGGGLAAAGEGASPAPGAPACLETGTAGDATKSECPSWCEGQHPAGSASHSGESVEIGGGPDGPWHALVYLTTQDLAYRSPEDGTAKVGLELEDGDENSVEASISLDAARQLSRTLAGLAKAGHLSRGARPGECPSWCQGQHRAGSSWHSGEGIEIGGEAEGSWSGLVGLFMEDGVTRVDFEFCDGDEDTTVAANISLSGTRKFAQSLGALATAGHPG